MAIGADRWILNTGYRRFSAYWWREVWKIPGHYVVHKYQRFNRGFSDADMVNGCDYLADVISATAWWHFSNCNGYPGVPPGETYEAWLDTLLEIYEAFRRDEDDIDWAPADMAWDLLRENYAGLWD